MRGAWLTSQLTTVGAHLPAKFPKDAAELLPPKEVAKPVVQQTQKQWAALFSHILQKPVKIDRPEPEA